jgi:putative ABC transport system substrate-binding protein
VNKRRTLLIALGSAWAASPLGLAQQAKRTYRLGWLLVGTADIRAEPFLVAFTDRLRELGFVEGRNLSIEVRAAAGKIERLPELAAELGRTPSDVLLVAGAEAGLAALKHGTRDTPIVVVAFDFDPVATGHVASFARPGGRITGISPLQTVLPAKRLELLKDLLPNAKRFAVFADSASMDQLKVAQSGAKQLGVELHVIEFKRGPYDYESAFAAAVRAKCAGLLALGSSFFVPARELIPALALKYRLPSIHHNSVWADAGGLLSYGPNFSSDMRRAAEQVAMIFNGKNPADIPVEQPTTFELVINMKTAKALGITIPQTILVRAERVIE